MNYLKLGLLTIFHPIRSFELMKRNRESLNMLVPLILLTLTIAIRFIYIFNVNFTVSTIRVIDANIIIEMSKILIPFIAWFVCSFALLSIMGGEATFKETLVGCAYCMSPYIFFTIPIMILSKVISGDEASIYAFISNIIIAWVILLFFINLKTANDITIKKTIGITMLTLFSMLVLSAVLLILVAIIVQLGIFVKEITNELKLIK